jgi:hypothetical protein
VLSTAYRAAAAPSRSALRAHSTDHRAPSKIAAAGVIGQKVHLGHRVEELGLGVSFARSRSYCLAPRCSVCADDKPVRTDLDRP